jgi:hypothetical protein
MPKIQSKTDNLAERQKRLRQDLEGVGDILVFQTQRRKNKDVIDGLKRLQEIVKMLFAIQEKDPEQFERLILAQEFYDLQDEDKENAQLGLAFNPDKYLISFTTAIDQIIRIHEAAIESKNPEASRFAAYNIVWLLGDFSASKDKGLFIERLLYQLAHIARYAAKHDDISQYSAAVHWYTDIVFDRYHKDREFLLDYLELFNKHFFASIRQVIRDDYPQLFREFVKHTVDGFFTPSITDADAWSYAHLLSDLNFELYRQVDTDRGVEKLAKELTDSIRGIDLQDGLKAWLEKFDELKAAIEPNLDATKLALAKTREEKIKEAATTYYKYNNLLEMVFSIGAYCLFLSYGLSESRESYIKYLWEYKQPGDSDTSWMGHNIVPVTFNDAIDSYFRKSTFQRKYDFQEDHHGAEIYHKQYFLLLLAKTLQGVKPTEVGEYPQFESYSLPPLSVHRLSDIEYSVDGLISIAKDLKKRKESLKSLGFEKDSIKGIFDEKLIPLLEILKRKATERIALIHQEQAASPQKISEFMDQVLSAYNKAHKVRDVLKAYDLYEDRSAGPYAGPLQPFGINIVDDKAIFFEEWNVHFGNWGENYGEDLARGENNEIMKAVLSSAVEITEENMGEVFAAAGPPEDLFILSTNGATFMFFNRKEGFKSRWRRDTEQLEINGFEGWYEFNGGKAPVFDIYDASNDRQVLLLNKKKLGKLVQYSPLDSADQAASQKDIFFMKVKPLSEHPELVRGYLEKAPKWLTEVGDAENQKKYLLKRVVIHVNERFELVKDEAFQAYVLKING